MIHARPTKLLRVLPGIWLALAWLMAACVPAQAQQAGGNNIRVTLAADGKPRPGSDWMIAIRFTPTSTEWHGYWKNPGDAGVGMRLQWRLPDGWRAGEPLYPVPTTLSVAGLMNHVFEGDHAVLVPIAVPRDADVRTIAPITLDIDYLACTDRICVPERARLTLDPATAAPDPRFDRWRAALAPPLDRAANYELGRAALRLAIPLPADLPLRAPHVFIAQRDLVDYAAPQRYSRAGDRLIVELPLAKTVTPPSGVNGILALGDGNGFRFDAVSGPVPAPGTPLGGGAAPALWFALLGAFLGGLLLNVMPCVFPILSLKALALARAGGEERAARRDALAYTAGAILACLGLGAAMLALRAGGEQVGWAFQLQEPAVVAALLVIAVAITASFLGLFEMPALAISGRGSGGGGSFATGLLAAFVATPCTGPFMAAALGAALLLPPVEALALFAALGLGLALPFLMLGYYPPLRRMLPRPGPWMERFRRVMALPMGLTALALAWLAWRLGGVEFALAAIALAAVFTAMLGMLWGSRRGRSALRYPLLTVLGSAAIILVVALPRLEASAMSDAQRSMLDAAPFTEPALAAARASGKPVFVWFTADWCLTCKVNEAAAIERESTRAAFENAGVVALRGDWTRRDEAITRFLTAQGAAGVPLYLWYQPGEAAPRQLPQVLTPALLAGLARGSAAPDRQAARSD